MKKYSQLTQQKHQINLAVNNLQKQLKEIEVGISNPTSYCDEIFTEDKFIEFYQAGVIHDIEYFTKLIGTNLEHYFEKISHSDGRDYYSNTYECKYCGKKRSEITKR